MGKFIFSTVVLITILLSCVSIGAQYHWFNTIPSYFIEIIFFLGISTAVIFRFLIRPSLAPYFTQAYLLSIVLKMLGYGAFILVIIFKDRSGAFGNALVFIISYLLFTALEVGFLFARINR